VINIALVADSGTAMEAMTRSVSTLARVDIVRHCHGHAPIAPALLRFTPDLVLVDEMGWPKLALQRITEIRATLPHALIVVRTERPEAAWLADALRAGASAVVPATAGPETLGVVLAEVVRERELEALPHPPALAA
jgi:DNA-binding NarL/FixJ family response regulator